MRSLSFGLAASALARSVASEASNAERLPDGRALASAAGSVTAACSEASWAKAETLATHRAAQQRKRTAPRRRRGAAGRAIGRFVTRSSLFSAPSDLTRP